VVVVGDDDVVDRAPAVDLWIRLARRRGAELVTIGARGSIPAAPGAAAQTLLDLVGSRSALGKRLRDSGRAVLIWSGAGGGGGARLAEAAEALGFATKPGCAAYHLPAAPNARGVAEAWASCADEDEVEHDHVAVLVVSGDDAASDPGVRALAESADAVIAITMFHSLTVGWADLVLPATAALEREGTSMNLEGRVQRLRRTVTPPVPDELAWLSRLASRFGVDFSPHPAVLFEELSERIYGGLGLEQLAEHAPLPPRVAYEAPDPAKTTAEPAPTPTTVAGDHFVGTLRLLRFRPLFSGPQVERVAELAFQRPEREVSLSSADANRRGIATGDVVTLRSNGTSVELRARIDRKLVEGVARVAEEHAEDLHLDVEVVKL
jgi:anaerobic selenocysteine-containing dehydrogenase